jgi:hypothetical protein
MTATMNPTTNGSTRKNLASQLDRLDQMLDGLAEGLNEAVVAAVKAAVTVAVEQAVRAVLAEVLTNPALLDKLRGVTPPAPAAPKARWSRLTGRVRQAGTWLTAGLAAGWRGVRGTVGSVAGGVRRTVANARARWQAVRRFQIPLVRAVTVGVAVGVAAYFARPWLAALASGVGGFTAMMAVQAGLWLRRTFGGAPPTADA